MAARVVKKRSRHMHSWRFASLAKKHIWRSQIVSIMHLHYKCEIELRVYASYFLRSKGLGMNSILRSAERAGWNWCSDWLQPRRIFLFFLLFDYVTQSRFLVSSVCTKLMKLVSDACVSCDCRRAPTATSPPASSRSGLSSKMLAKWSLVEALIPPSQTPPSRTDGN